jgi:NAD-dependent DNA ligase
MLQSDPTKVLPLAGYVMCITGEFLPTERDTLSKMLSALGATMKSGVSKKLTHLLVGEGAGQSKLSKAKELNLPMLKREWLVKTLEANGMALKNDSKFETEWDDL